MDETPHMMFAEYTASYRWMRTLGRNYSSTLMTRIIGAPYPLQWAIGSMDMINGTDYLRMRLWR